MAEKKFSNPREIAFELERLIHFPHSMYLAIVKDGDVHEAAVRLLLACQKHDFTGKNEAYS